ncbi:DUF2306 domain-containing protein [Pleomorphovibrio marinus]|uniref:DUF2306 domain-containing protein n=1 Tax=Pleomorphovibrio marinus TaxID=2164132 RepID=UPI000E0C1346|nr:DUF2306 domain-containing protein [Pleomorphovibrio marinus]
MKGRFLYYLMAIAAVAIGIYPMLYFVIDRHFGLLQSKETWLLQHPIWNIGFYTHIVFGGIALLTGWIQFAEKWRNANLVLHRQLGKAYLVSVWLSALGGIYIGFYATGGLIPSTGFISLGVLWLLSTHVAYLLVRRKKMEGHRKWMVYSYSLCFAAVTLRIWLPLLSTLFGDFLIAYKITSWLCWVPNLIVAHIINLRKSPNVGAFEPYKAYKGIEEG